MKSFILILLIALLPQLISAQTTKRDTIILKNLKSLSTEERIFKIDPGFGITGLNCKIKPGNSFEGSFILAGNDTIVPHIDENRGTENGFVSSEIIIFREKISQLTLKAENIQDTIIFFYIDASMPEFIDNKIEVKKKKESASCSEPAMIDQDEWRVGLTAPDYAREVHVVKNIIIHHSAGQILSDNYYEVVRTIYLFHTVDRGWSDIGYNYLITHDGSLFKGRDPAGHEQDNVKGAHFCGSNTGTMGICVIGEYIEDTPSTEALNNLNNLLTWKVVKDNLHPLGTNSHPLNENLPVIAGHRDGCATECPGQLFYEMFPSIRQNVIDSAMLCPSWEPTQAHPVIMVSEEPLLYPNPVKETLLLKYQQNIEKIIFVDITGKICKSLVPNNKLNEYIIDVSNLYSGVYMIIINSDTKITQQRILVH